MYAEALCQATKGTLQFPVTCSLISSKKCSNLPGGHSLKNKEKSENGKGEKSMLYTFIFIGFLDKVFYV
jgi:hypothetical protein